MCPDTSPASLGARGVAERGVRDRGVRTVCGMPWSGTRWVCTVPGQARRSGWVAREAFRRSRQVWLAFRA